VFSGSVLLKVGQYEQKLGAAERELISSSAQGFIHPLQKFLDGEMRTIVRERKILETKRLDLDCCKSKLRKARSLEAQHNVSSF
jgi:endophilin-B